ncbi:MAG: TatD family hydrolase [Actinomycetaceae bacterium]|nr:TatD family hydrolase [Actinomycetaceae bacterium]
MTKKKRNVYPDVAEPLAHPIVDNHTHLPVRGDRDYEADVGLVPGSPAPAGGDGLASAGDGPAPDDNGPASAGPHQAAPGPGEAHKGSIEWHIARMGAAGVRHAITCGCEVPTLAPTVALAEAYPELSAAIAIHPNEAPLHCGITEVGPDGLAHGLDPWHSGHSLADAVALVGELARSGAVVAIGETGLDYFRTADAGKAAQAESFRMHIALAKELDLPLQIHDRQAHADCIAILKECGAPERTVFHCFSGDREMAEVCATNGWYASFAGPLTYPANEDLREAFLALPEHLILVETDAPYLTPAPWRGHPNAPYACAYTARYMASLRGVDEADWCRRLDENTRRVYGV